jgi:hypothetical protein
MYDQTSSRFPVPREGSRGERGEAVWGPKSDKVDAFGLAADRGGEAEGLQEAGRDRVCTVFCVKGPAVKRVSVLR